MAPTSLSPTEDPEAPVSLSSGRTVEAEMRVGGEEDSSPEVRNHEHSRTLLSRRRETLSKFPAETQDGLWI